MIVTRELSFHSSVLGLTETLSAKLSELGLSSNPTYRQKLAGSLADIIMLDTDNGSIVTSKVRASWHWDPEEHLLIRLEVSSVE